MSIVAQHAGVVYLLTAPSGERYVGRAVDFPARMRHYKSGHGHGAVGAAIAAHGWEAMRVSTIAQGISDAALPKCEAAFIALIRPELNLQTQRGGRVRHAESTKQKIGDALRGKSPSPETRAKRSASMRGKPSPLRGRKRSPEAIAKSAAFHCGRKRSAETRARMSEAQRRFHGHPF